MSAPSVDSSRSIKTLREKIRATRVGLTGSAGSTGDGSGRVDGGGAAINALHSRLRTTSVDVKAAAAKLMRERKALLADMESLGILADGSALGKAAPPPGWPWAELPAAFIGEAMPKNSAPKPKQQPSSQQWAHIGQDNTWVKRAAAEHVNAVFSTLISPLRSACCAMMDSEAIMPFSMDAAALSRFANLGDSQGSGSKNGSSVIGLSMKSASGINATAVDAWSAFAEMWKDPPFVAGLMVLGDVPSELSFSSTACHMLPLMVSAIGSALVAFEAVLATNCPKLVTIDCLDAASCIAQGVVGSSWRTLACRIDATMDCTLDDREGTSHADLRALPRCSPSSAFASGDISAILAVTLLESATSIVSHINVEAGGDDAESAVSLTGTRAPAARASDALETLRFTVNTLRDASVKSLVSSVGNMFKYCIGPDYVSQKWLTHAPFFGNKTTTHAVRYSFTYLILQLLTPLNESLQALGFVSAASAGASDRHAGTWFDVDAIRALIGRTVFAAFANEWRSLITATKSTEARTPQLLVDVLAITRFVRAMRAWYTPAPPDVLRLVELPLLEAVASVALRTHDLVEVSKRLALSAPGSDASVNDFWGPTVWECQQVQLVHDSGAASACNVSPLQCYAATSDVALQNHAFFEPVSRTQLLASRPSIFAAVPPAQCVSLGLPCSGNATLLTVLQLSTHGQNDAAAEATFSAWNTSSACREALRQRWELWSDYPALEEDDELLAVDILKKMAAE